MARVARLVPFVLALPVLTGCVGGPGGDGTAPTESPSPTPSPPPAVTPFAVSDSEAVDRALDAEAARIGRVADERPNVTFASVGGTRTPTHDIVRRNGTGVAVQVTVGYSVSFDCGHHVDGATTKAQYFVTETETRLVAVFDPVYGRDNRPCR